uniref:LOC398774 protein n=1 Tax=Xenopus laevis TaxID=8355 RepID=Q4V801_XENLA|nr:LOC398774 protein [Xenopus laevis]
MDSVFLLAFLVFAPLCILSQTLQESGPGTVKPSESLRLTCTVSGFELRSYSMDWIRQPPGKGLEWIGLVYSIGSTSIADSLKNRVTITKDNGKKQVYLQMTGMEVKDTAMYYCARGPLTGVADYFDYWGQGTMVTVTSATLHAPSVFPLRPCCGSSSSDSHVTIGCLSTGFLPAPVDVKWNSGSITSGLKNFPAVLQQSGLFASSSQLTIPLSDWKAKKSFECNVEHKPTSTKVTQKIECQDEPEPEPIKPTVEILQGPCASSESVELLCLITGYAPSEIKVQWLLNGQVTEISPSNSKPCKEENDTFSSRSKVSVPKEDWNSGDSYTCKVTHPASHTKTEASTKKCDDTAITPKVDVLPPSPKDLLVTKEAKVYCVISRMTSTDDLTVQWSRSDGKKALAFDSAPEKAYDGTFTVKSTLKISPGDWENKKQFNCKVVHPDLPSPIEKSIQKSQDPGTEPTITLLPPSDDELRNDFISLICMLKNFRPQDIYVFWKKDGVTLEEDYYMTTTPVLEEEEEGFISFSKLTIARSDWMRGATYSCIAAHNTISQRDIKKNRGK